MNSMLSIRKFYHSKLKFSFEKKGRHGEKYVRSSRVKTVINEEYREALRTKSYTEFFDKIHGQIEARISLDDANSISSSPTSSSPPSPTTVTPEHVHLSEYLVELRRETVVSISQSSKNHHFLTNYFDISLEAGRICELILQNAHQLRDNYRLMRRVINSIEQRPDHKIWSHNQHNGIYKNLESFALNTNPFSSTTAQKFHELHEIHQHLFHQLTSKCEKTEKKKKIRKCIKRVLAIVGCGALAVALFLLAFHTAVGVVAAAPGLIMSSLAFFAMKKLKRSKAEMKKEGLETQIDVAAKEIYVVINEFDTMRRLVQRLHDEMEHWKSAAETSVRTGKKEAWKQVVRDFKMHECCFLEQLEELEKQICLCFLHINRSRRVLIQELDK